MQWQQLLSRKRLGRSDDDVTQDDLTRTDFQRDFDRIVFSAAFRRLQDKTQVFPLVRTGGVRTRLTHSLEASCVGRTLGTMVGAELIKRHHLQYIYPQDFGAIVAAACLAHDIGNPPFGHAGEDAIRHWFHSSATGQDLMARLPAHQRDDLLRFEGNAQGFRLLTRLQSGSNRGGLQLTAATLGAFSKYPCASGSQLPADIKHYVAFKKFGFMQAELDLFDEVAQLLALAQINATTWHRHPLSYLVEAADDICYLIVDVEDAYRLKHISYHDAEQILQSLLATNKQQSRLAAIHDPKQRIEFLRAKSIGELVDQVVSCFLDHEDALLQSRGATELLTLVPRASELAALKRRSSDEIYLAAPVAEIAAAGFQVLGGLLDAFVAAVNDVAECGSSASAQSVMLLRLVPEQCIGVQRQPNKDLYLRLLGITDFVSGMTDSYAVNLYKKLTGMSLPATL